MPSLNSSAISFVRYDATSGELRITFSSGGTYTYFGVPPEVYDGLMNADSAGRYFHAVIRPRYGLR